MKNRARNPRLKGARVNPLKLDPTRTTTLRKTAIADVRRRFARLALAIDELIVRQDSFGLNRRRNGPPSPFATNVFCATGEGGGVDPTCGKGEGDVSSQPRDLTGSEQYAVSDYKGRGYNYINRTLREKGMEEFSDGTRQQVRTLDSLIARSKTAEDMTLVRVLDGKRIGDKHLKEGAVIEDKGFMSTSTSEAKAHRAVADASVGGVKTSTVIEIRVPKGTTALDLEAHRVGGSIVKPMAGEGEYLLPRGTRLKIVKVDKEARRATAEIVANVTTNAFCPTGPGIIPDASAPLSSAGKRATDRLVKKLSTNARWELKSSPEQLAAFQEWLKKQLKWYVIGMTENQLWARYVEEGFRKGAGRAFDDVKSRRGKSFRSDDFLQGERRQFFATSFHRPETVEKMKILASRTFEELTNVGEEIKLKLGRTLTDGLARGENPRVIARTMRDQLAIPMRRAETIARTEIIRAHAEGQLAAMEELGIDEVGVMVEWSTAGDDRVCEACAPMEGVVLKLEEATGMIPRHPNCRCSWIPANVGESRRDQTRGKTRIEKQIDLSARIAGDQFDEGRPIAAYRPRALVSPTRNVVNAFCPTGPGGGVDPTCPANTHMEGDSHGRVPSKATDQLTR